jgi:hypothetical protein
MAQEHLWKTRRSTASAATFRKDSTFILAQEHLWKTRRSTASAATFRKDSTFI